MYAGKQTATGTRRWDESNLLVLVNLTVDEVPSRRRARRRVNEGTCTGQFTPVSVSVKLSEAVTTGDVEAVIDSIGDTATNGDFNMVRRCESTAGVDEIILITATQLVAASPPPPLTPVVKEAPEFNWSILLAPLAFLFAVITAFCGLICLLALVRGKSTTDLPRTSSSSEISGLLDESQFRVWKWSGNKALHELLVDDSTR